MPPEDRAMTRTKPKLNITSAVWPDEETIYDGPGGSFSTSTGRLQPSTPRVLPPLKKTKTAHIPSPGAVPDPPGDEEEWEDEDEAEDGKRKQVSCFCDAY